MQNNTLLKDAKKIYRRGDTIMIKTGDLLVSIFLTSGNIVEVRDDLNNINPTKTLDYFEKVASKFRDNATANDGTSVGYFRYGGTSIAFKYVEAIQISDTLYRECGVVSINANNDNEDENRSYNACAFIGTEMPKTDGDFVNGFFYIEN